MDDCELDSLDDNGFCTLHCEKSDYSTDFSKIGFLRKFYDSLSKYIVEEIFEYKEESDDFNKFNVYDYLVSDNTEELVSVEITLKNTTVVFTKIKFPSYDSRDNFDYTKILCKLRRLHFNYCDFNCNEIKIKEAHFFYQDCNFHMGWSLSESNILPNYNDVIYQACIFNQEVDLYSDTDKEKYKLDNPQFCDCVFNKRISFYGVEISAPIFNNSEDYESKIEALLLEKCSIDKRFVLNNHVIELLSIDSCEMNAKFEFKYNVIDKFDIFNTNFYKLVDVHETVFKDFSIRKSIFNDFVAFEKCKFGYSDGDKEECLSVFLYVTFLGFVNFRNAIFYNGLDIENVNLKENPNFLNCSINSDDTNRETYRIIKNSFDKAGNFIEANKYFMCEMNAYKIELMNKKFSQERLVLILNEKISNYGQSYKKPIAWLILSLIFYSILIKGYNSYFLYELWPSANNFLYPISNFLNSVAKNFLPFQKFLKEGVEFSSLMFYIINISFIWQIIVSVKRHTKR